MSRLETNRDGSDTEAEQGFTVLIPARLASSRLPDKPLTDIASLPMVVRVAQAAARSGAARVVVACELLRLGDDAIVVNVQGDEPLIEPALIDAVARLLAERPDASMGTAAHPIASVADFTNPNVVKVVLDARQLALYFSRAPIPWWRDGFAQGIATLPQPAPLRHIGIYAYRAGFLRQFPALPQAPIETGEALEQLRVLWHGHRIAVHVTEVAPGAGVDTPADLERVRRFFAS